MNAIKLSIVIPVYRSESILPALAREVSCAVAMLGYETSFELILVNDASPDDSWDVIKSLSAQYPFVHGICLSRNYGQHNATMAGLNRCRGDIIVVMDDDLQHPPDAISDLLSAIENGFDVCYTRYENRQHPYWKKLGSWFNDQVANYILGKPHGLYLSSFKGMKKWVATEIVKYDGPYAYLDGLILDVTQRITSIPIYHQPRLDGDGNYNLKRSVSLWLKMATSFSVLPLRLASICGFFLAGVSVIFVAIVVVEKLLHPEITAGWTSLMATVLFIGGIQLLCLGVIGEYLGRAYLKLNRKPQFSIREEVKS
jgi:undecaprenyl-phosphate 4-deoxy-4-formamido-L-arabinose transferase